MKPSISLAFIGSALALSACGKTPDQRFEEMYKEQLANDPVTAAQTAKAYKYRDTISDHDKTMIVDMYEDMKQARKNAGVGPPR